MRESAPRTRIHLGHCGPLLRAPPCTPSGAGPWGTGHPSPSVSEAGSAEGARSDVSMFFQTVLWAAS